MRLFLRLSGIVLFAGVVVAAIMTPAKQSSLVSGLSPAVEIAELEARIASTRKPVSQSILSGLRGWRSCCRWFRTTLQTCSMTILSSQEMEASRPAR
ncbi:hypothetical protein KJZ99_06445 [bacterium]|nr:hypothetical protein [bacterium]